MNFLFTYARYLITVLIIVCIIAAFILVTSYAVFRIVFYNANKVPDDPHRIPKGPRYDILDREIHQLVSETLAIPFKQIYITSRDGIKLAARLYETSPSAPVALLMHGWHGISCRDFAAGLQIHLAKGHNVVLVDERAHNKSGGHVISFGIKERYDCLDWINWILTHFGPQTYILLHGVSMGGATVLMAAGLHLPANVKGIISDSGYTSPKEIICKVCSDYHVKPALAWPFIKTGAKVFGHFNPEETSARQTMTANTLPVMFVHGTGDDFVPCVMGDELYALTKGPKYQVRVPGAPHVLAYMYDVKAYLTVMDEFCSEVLGPESSPAAELFAAEDAEYKKEIEGAVESGLI